MIEAEIIQCQMLLCWMLNPHSLGNNLQHIQWRVQVLNSTVAPSSLHLKGLECLSIPPGGAHHQHPSRPPHKCTITLICNLQIWLLAWCSFIAKMGYREQCPLTSPNRSFIMNCSLRYLVLSGDGRFELRCRISFGWTHDQRPIKFADMGILHFETINFFLSFFTVTGIWIRNKDWSGEGVRIIVGCDNAKTVSFIVLLIYTCHFFFRIKIAGLLGCWFIPSSLVFLFLYVDWKSQLRLMVV